MSQRSIIISRDGYELSVKPWELDWTGKPYCVGTLNTPGAGSHNLQAFAGCLDELEPIVVIYDDGALGSGPDDAAKAFVLSSIGQL